MLLREEKDSPTCTKKIRQAKCKNVTIKKFNNNTKTKLELWH